MRKNMLVQIVLLLSLLVLSSIVGCSDRNNGVDTKNTEIETTETKAGGPVQDGKTLWFILKPDGQKQYLSDDNPEVKSIMSLITEHSVTVDTRSYNNIDMTQEFHCYTLELQEQLSDYKKRILSTFKDSRLEQKNIRLYWRQMSFNETLEECKVTVTDLFKIIDADDKYFQETDLKKDTAYYQIREFTVIKQNGEWKINDLSKSDLSESNIQ